MNDGKGTERAMVHHVRIGDRQNDAEAVSELFGEFTFQINNVRLTIALLLGVHSMVGGDADNGAKFNQPRHFEIYGAVEIKSLRRIRRGSLPHIIGGRKIEKIGN